MSQAMKKLLDICDIESDEKNVGWKKRRDEMEKWISKHVLESETSLSVINAEVFNSELLDFIKEKLVQDASEELTTHTKYEYSKNRITAKLLIIKE